MLKDESAPASLSGKPDHSVGRRLPARPPLVGREAEIGFLKSQYDEVAAGGPGRFLLLVGEPGIGKTRVAEELVSSVRVAGGQAYWGRGADDAGATAYWPWVQVIRAYARDRPPGQLRSELGPGATDIAGVVSELAERLPGLPPQPTLQPDHARFRFFDRMTGFFRNAGPRQPLVIVLDDLHWADEPFLLLTEFLTREVRGCRLLLVGTYRSAEYGRSHPFTRLLGAIAREPATARLVLGGLSSVEVEVFVATAMGQPPSPALVDALVEKTNGNPFFVTEVVRLLATEERLAATEESPRARLPLPPTVREAIGRRLEYLPARSLHLVTIGALIGREFNLGFLERVSGAAGEQLLEELEPALAARLLVEQPGLVGHYSFVHALVRDTLIAEIQLGDRARLHRQIGQALEDLYPLDRGAHLSELAHHFSLAGSGGSIDRADGYAVEAAEHTSRILAFEEAARHYELAVELAGLAGRYPFHSPLRSASRPRRCAAARRQHRARPFGISGGRRAGPSIRSAGPARPGRAWTWWDGRNPGCLRPRADHPARRSQDRSRRK